MRFAMGIEYDGAAYAGWQHQGHARTLQQVVETALTAVAAEPIKVVAAGRTDAGVHATLQVVHFDTVAERRERGWLLGTNSNLPGDVGAQWIRPVPDSFSARFSALSRSYRYLIVNRPQRPALVQRHAAWVHAAQLLVGQHDFSSFRASSCQARSPVRDLRRIGVVRRDDWIAIDVTANAFLHHMVRNMVGSLLLVGRGEQGLEWFGALIAARDRRAAGITAPPTGLYLVDVEYAAEHGLPRGRPPDLAGSAPLPPGPVHD
jgi:tRNA pseudouridine38-40 synthase